jgi:hypothetical protein
MVTLSGLYDFYASLFPEIGPRGLEYVVSLSKPKKRLRISVGNFLAVAVVDRNIT